MVSSVRSVHLERLLRFRPSAGHSQLNSLSCKAYAPPGIRVCRTAIRSRFLSTIAYTNCQWNYFSLLWMPLMAPQQLQDTAWIQALRCYTVLVICIT